MLDGDDVAFPAVAQVHGRWLAEQVVHIAVEQDQIRGEIVTCSRLLSASFAPPRNLSNSRSIWEIEVSSQKMEVRRQK